MTQDLFDLILSTLVISGVLIYLASLAGPRKPKGKKRRVDK